MDCNHYEGWGAVNEDGSEECVMCRAEAAEARVADLEEQLAASEARADAAEANYERYRLAIENITAGGSEYHKDLDRCVAYIRDRFEQGHRIAVNEVKRRKEVEARVIELEQKVFDSAAEIGAQQGRGNGWKTRAEKAESDNARLAAEVERLKGTVVILNGTINELATDYDERTLECEKAESDNAALRERLARVEEWADGWTTPGGGMAGEITNLDRLRAILSGEA